MSIREVLPGSWTSRHAAREREREAAAAEGVRVNRFGFVLAGSIQ